MHQPAWQPVVCAPMYPICLTPQWAFAIHPPLHTSACCPVMGQLPHAPPPPLYLPPLMADLWCARVAWAASHQVLRPLREPWCTGVFQGWAGGRGSAPCTACALQDPAAHRPVQCRVVCCVGVGSRLLRPCCVLWHGAARVLLPSARNDMILSHALPLLLHQAPSLGHTSSPVVHLVGGAEIPSSP